MQRRALAFPLLVLAPLVPREVRRGVVHSDGRGAEPRVPPHRHGLNLLFGLVTHGILSGKALKNIQESALEKLIVTNTLPQEENVARCSKIEVIDIGGVLAEVIRRSHYGESVSKLFDEVPY